MKYIIMHETVTNHDAIGNDIEGMYEVLGRKHDCSIFAINQFNDNVRYIGKKQLENGIMDPNTVLIYHHSVYWEYGFEILQKAVCKRIVKYHNITPEEYFSGFNEWHYSQCKKGRDQTKRMVQELPGMFWLCDSKYNASEIDVPEQYIGICPPFNKIESWNSIKPNETILRKLAETDSINLLFVGRIAPNKDYLHALEIVRQYCLCYDHNIKIRFIGKLDNGLKPYNDMIRNFISENNITDNVQFIGETTDKDLLSYYLGSDLMLCCSQHEGFCVPVIEAQHLGLPIIAVKSSAVPETIGEEQLCIDWSNKHLVAAIRVVSQNEKYAAFLRNKGFENYNSRFSYSSICKVFLQELERGNRTI